MVGRQAAFFLAGLNKHICVELIVCAASNRALLDEQFKAIITRRTEVDLVLTAFTEFLRQQGIGKGLAALREVVTVESPGGNVLGVTFLLSKNEVQEKKISWIFLISNFLER